MIPDVPNPPGFDWAKVKTGEIPWTAAGYMEVVQFRMKLDRTPQDDWDLAPRRVAFEIEGDVEVFGLNMLMRENQIGVFIRDHYEDHTVAASQIMRYFEMNYFLKTHQPRFKREGFIRPDPEREPGRIEVNDRLFQALAESRYTKTRGRGKHKFPTFDLEAIIKRTKELTEEEDEEASGG